LKNKTTISSYKKQPYLNKRTGKFKTPLFSLIGMLILLMSAGCKVYRFKDVAIPQDVKTIKINYIENRARLVNPQLSPRLSDRLRQKILSQTKLTQTNNDNADWDVSGEITEYAVSTSGISNQQVSSNRITVSVHVEIYKRKDDKTDKYDVSRNFEFSANLSLQQAEAALGDEIIRTLTDDIFNRIFSEW
jgi:hypothetical protein